MGARLELDSVRRRFLTDLYVDLTEKNQRDGGSPLWCEVTEHRAAHLTEPFLTTRFYWWRWDTIFKSDVASTRHEYRATPEMEALYTALYREMSERGDFDHHSLTELVRADEE